MKEYSSQKVVYRDYVSVKWMLASKSEVEQGHRFWWTAQWVVVIVSGL